MPKFNEWKTLKYQMVDFYFPFLPHISAPTFVLSCETKAWSFEIHKRKCEGGKLFDFGPNIVYILHWIQWS